MKPHNTDNQVMDPHKGLSLGNLFPNLYQDYKGFTNYPLNPQNDRERKLLKVQELCFAMIELDLYLDNHPNDDEKAKLFAKYSKEHKEKVNEYEKEYGPLTIDSAAKTDKWKWNNGPWPWEKSR